jgi:hypothetical protein
MLVNGCCSKAIGSPKVHHIPSCRHNWPVLVLAALKTVKFNPVQWPGDLPGAVGTEIEKMKPSPSLTMQSVFRFLQ